jgi:thiol-disulfide isomerase/thioredoxin
LRLPTSIPTAVLAALAVAHLASPGAARAVQQTGAPAQEKVVVKIKELPAVKLAVADPAPALRVGRWIAGEPVASFELGRVYVVDVWATWAPPCRASIPFLSDLQARYEDRGVRVIGVSVLEDDHKAPQVFVEKLGTPVRYPIATDYVPERAKPNQGSTYLRWIRASVQDSIPTTFLIDGTGRVAWVGEPLAVEEPLVHVLAGTWDIEKARAKFYCRVRVNQLGYRLREQLDAGAWADALQTIDAMTELDPSCESRIAAYRFRTLLYVGREEEAYAYGRKVVDGALKEHALALNVIAWAIVDPKAPTPSLRRLDFALEVAKRACELTSYEDPAILDTLALIHFESGDVEKALEYQEKAAKLAAGGRWEEEIQARLAKFREAAKKKGDAGGKAPDELAIRR